MLIVGIALLAEMPGASCVAADISADALQVARKNAERHGVGSRMTFQIADLLEGVDGRFGFVVSNPPYIPSEEIETLAREVREHDPALALDGGQDGLAVIHRILATAGHRLEPAGRLYLELGIGQLNACVAEAGGFGWRHVGTERDLSGLERTIVLERL